MEEKKDKILEEERDVFQNQLKEILDAGPDKYQRKERNSIINESSLRKDYDNYREVEDKKYIFLYTLIRIIAVAVALFLLVKFGINIASR